MFTLLFLKKNWDLILLSIFIIIYCVTFSTLSILRHDAFASNYDLANMSQTVWNTLHGRPFALSGAEGTISRFSIHADLILVLLSPLYLIWERAYMLLIAQSFALGLGAIPVFFLSKKVLKDKFTALILSLVYLLNPSMQWVNIYDFHGVALAIPFLLAAFYFAYAKKWRWFWLFTALSLITKEEISLFIAMLGLFIFFVFKQRRIGIMTFLIGLTWFSLMVFIIIPKFSPDGQYWALNWFLPVSTSSNFLEKAIKQFLLASDTLNYYLSLLKPFGFLPLLGLPWLLLSLPELAINVLSTQAQMRSTFFHYDSGIIPALVIATIFGLKYLRFSIGFIKLLKPFSKSFFYFIVVILLLIALRVNYHYSPLPTTPSCWCISYHVSEEDRQFAKVLASIPKNASVSSSGEVRPHIARRENSFTLPGHVNDADYVAILDQNRIVGDYSPKEFENALLKDPKFLSSHELINHTGHFFLFKRK